MCKLQSWNSNNLTSRLGSEWWTCIMGVEFNFWETNFLLNEVFEVWKFMKFGLKRLACRNPVQRWSSVDRWSCVDCWWPLILLTMDPTSLDRWSCVDCWWPLILLTMDPLLTAVTWFSGWSVLAPTPTPTHPPTHCLLFMFLSTVCLVLAASWKRGSV